MRAIPRATAKRLPLYYRFLQNVQSTGKTRISSTELSAAVKVDAATIRRDFSYFGALGKKGYGYNVQYLLRFFQDILEQDVKTGVILVGVGNLGTALLNYNFQKNHNIRIVQAYDINEHIIGKEIAGVPVFDMRDLQAEHIRECPVAILAVPARVAQATTKQIVDAGVTGILNFTPTRLDVPGHVRIHHIDLTVELHSLVYFLKHYPLPGADNGGDSL